MEYYICNILHRTILYESYSPMDCIPRLLSLIVNCDKCFNHAINVYIHI